MVYTELFVSEVDIQRISALVTPAGDCALWTGAVTDRGYGTYKLESGVQTSIHRIAYIVYHGSIPDGLVVMHSCNNKLCIAEAHLVAGTQQQNHLDSLADGLFVPPHGEEHWAAVLDADLVRYIRSKASEGRRARDISLEVGIARQTVQDVIARRTWKHVE